MRTGSLTIEVERDEVPARPRTTESPVRVGRLVAICTSAGGVPKRPLVTARITRDGVAGDQHSHAKHNRSDRAISLFDIEILRELVAEGFPLEPGTAGENLTVEGLDIQHMHPGDILQIGDVTLQLEQPRKPCYVLDAIDPRLKEAIVGRCGYMASVLHEGRITAGMPIRVHRSPGPPPGGGASAL